jgi:hypothetical protein
MPSPINNSSPLPLASKIACMVQNVCAPSTPTAKAGDFDKLLKQATDLAAAGYGVRDAAVNGFFMALNAATTFDQATAVLQAVPHGFGYRDVTYAALSASTRRIETREQALTVAGEAFERGHAYDNWAIGALDKGLALSSGTNQILEIASLARDHDHLKRFQGIREKALNRLR